jgi:hypothetical protein
MRFIYRVISVSLLLFAYSCNRQPTGILPTASLTAPATQTETVEISTAVPSDTPTSQPVAPPLALFIIPVDISEDQASEIIRLLQPALVEAGLEWEARESIEGLEIAENIRLVTAIQPGNEIQAVARSSPATQFLVFSSAQIEPAPNLSLVSLGDQRLDQQSFMAGVIATMSTIDWRVGIITDSSPEGLVAGQSFVNGGVYFCGMCRQIYPPFFDDQNQLIRYPLATNVPVGADESQWLTAVDWLVARGVKTVYIQPHYAQDDLLSYIGGKGLKIIGSSAPPEGLQNSWLASLAFDYENTVVDIMPEILGGKGGHTISATLAITHPNPENFSPGRQILAEKIMDDLLAGFIDPNFTAPSETP